MDTKPTKGVEYIEEIVDVDKILEEDKVEDEEEETPRRTRWGRKKKQEEDEKGDPEEIKARKKKREIEYKLSKLKSTLIEDNRRVSGKRQIKAPQRLELAPIKKKKPPQLAEGKGVPLGSLMWTSHQLGKSCLSTLRMLHRTIFRKQGNFIEKHIIKEVWKFRGFPYKADSHQIKIRRQNLYKQKDPDLRSLCHLLGLPMGSHSGMVESIITFLSCPTENMVDNKYKAATIVEKAPARRPGTLPSDNFRITQSLLFINHLNPNMNQPDNIKHLVSSQMAGSEAAAAPWRRPAYFEEGDGVKLKYIRQVAANIEMANNKFIELLHRLLYLRVDEIGNMRQSILEFSGLKCERGANNNNLYRNRILSLIPADQVKLICRVLGLPTWHRSRQLLTDGIMDFLAAPRISAMKRKVPPHFTDEISFSFETSKIPKPIPESEEYEKIEVFPDIHILPDDDEEDAPYEDCDSSSCLTNEYLGVKLKNFASIYYQVINSNAAKLNDVHMIMYLTTSTPSTVRNNVLEFAGFPFDESSKEYFCRKSFMEQMNLTELKYVAGILCVSQYIADTSKDSLIDAILKFLLKPSALLNSSTMMPTPSLATQWYPVVSSTSYTPYQNETFPGIMISEVKTLAQSDSPSNGISSTISVKQEQAAELERMKACLSSDIQIMPVTSIKVEDTSDEDIQTSKANTVQIYPVPQSSAEDEDVSLSRMKSKVMDVSSELAQIVERKRAYERERKRKQREKRRSNPEEYSEYCKIEKERNERRKAEGKLKSISQMNSMEETRIRSMWRANKVRQKQRQQDLANEKVFNKHRPRKRSKGARAQRARKMREKQQTQDVKDSDLMSEKTQPAENISPVNECPQNSEKLRPCSSSSEIPTSSKTQDSSVTTVPAAVTYVDSDDEDDKPLSKMIGHPNDDQLKALVTKIVKESKLEDVTMKIVIKKVFDNYPNFDLGYRKEFIKSIVRQILSQMEDQSRVSTTVNI
ncbi:hypothetical protein JTE90_006067 [Oedothorax gibbosus]|uniref:DEK-C domain-containing protein n=1 Tax=Oedothorax gibbosus TaxID=931172 RepID=A0AAV6V5X2_9ARAC|nr:hypothetical protein JTE90_006067 [Oedothorax gibbosus]